MWSSPELEAGASSRNISYRFAFLVERERCRFYWCFMKTVRKLCPSQRASRVLVLTLGLQRHGVTVVGVYTQLYRHCSEPLELVAAVRHASRARARETVHTAEANRRSTNTSPSRSSLDAPLEEQNCLVLTLVHNKGEGLFFILQIRQ